MLMPMWVILPGEDKGESKFLLLADSGSSPAKQEQDKCASQDAGRSGHGLSQRGLVRWITALF